MRPFTLFLCFGLMCGCGNGDNVRTLPVPSPQVGVTVSVMGFVTDPAGQGLPGATVEWTGLAEAWGDRGHGVATDSTGAYSVPVGPLESLVSDLVQLRVTKTGYVTSQRQVRVDAQNVRADFTLTSAPRNVDGIYLATFTASPSCAAKLPAMARERTYTARMHADGAIEWAGPTVNPPSGHRIYSAGLLSEADYSFYIDYERDPQSDDFHGIWDDFGNGRMLGISGKGMGTVHDAEITGTLRGLFQYWEPAVPPNGGIVGSFCEAGDHPFRFVKQ
jgi:hypothetical protein